MAVTEADLKKLQTQVNQLQRQVEELQNNVKELVRERHASTDSQEPRRELSERERAIQVLQRAKVTREIIPPQENKQPPTSRTPKTNKEIIELLKSKGLIGEPTEEEKQLAAEWRALPEEEKEKVNQALNNIRLDQTVAELIAEVRS